MRDTVAQEYIQAEPGIGGAKPDLLSFQEALARVRGEVKRRAPVAVEISRAVGRICAERVIVEEPVPPFANSAMDGFAVCYKDTEVSPCRLVVTGSSAAGDAPGSLRDARGTAWEIMTGAPVPADYDAVVKVEDVQILRCDSDGRPKEIQVLSPANSGSNIRSGGEDLKPGEEALSPGTMIMPQHIMVLATLGVAQVNVAPRPKVAVITTGRELVDNPSTPLAEGQIRNSNGPFLMSALEAMGGSTEFAGTVRDEPPDFLAKLEKIRSDGVDLIVTTGAVSMGRYDFIPQCLRDLGAEILFHKVAIRPGKPVLFARLPDGAHVLGLPGNPIAVAVGARFFVDEYFRSFQGREPEAFQKAVLQKSATKAPNLCYFARGRAETNAQGELTVTLLGGQASFMVGSYADADCWAILDGPVARRAAGDVVNVAPLHPQPWLV